MITLTDLKKKYKFNQAWIDRLGSPDKTLPNSHSRKRPLMRLYSEDRVVRLIEENRAEYDEHVARKKPREAAANKAVETKTKQLLDKVERIKFEIGAISKRDLVTRACRHYNEHQLNWRLASDNEGYFIATPDGDKAFLKRIQVNYLRHEYTTYDEELSRFYRQIGKHSAYKAIKDKVLDSIAESYPYLKDECDRQKSEQEWVF